MHCNMQGVLVPPTLRICNLTGLPVGMGLAAPSVGFAAVPHMGCALHHNWIMLRRRMSAALHNRLTRVIIIRRYDPLPAANDYHSHSARWPGEGEN